MLITRHINDDHTFRVCNFKLKPPLVSDQNIHFSLRCLSVPPSTFETPPSSKTGLQTETDYHGGYYEYIWIDSSIVFVTKVNTQIRNDNSQS